MYGRTRLADAALEVGNRNDGELRSRAAPRQRLGMAPKGFHVLQSEEPHAPAGITLGQVLALDGVLEGLPRDLNQLSDLCQRVAPCDLLEVWGEGSLAGQGEDALSHRGHFC